MKRRDWRFAAVLAGAGLVALLVGGCPNVDWSGLLDALDPNRPSTTDSNSPGLPTEPTDGRMTLQRFASGDELLSFLRSQRLGGSGYGSGDEQWRGGSADNAAAPMLTGAAGGSGAAETVTSYSTTNIQEVGVDESDVLKSDGAYLYIAKGRSLRIVRAAPSTEMAEVGRLDLGATAFEPESQTQSAVYVDRVHSMYLNGAHVILLANGGRYVPLPAGSEVIPPLAVPGGMPMPMEDRMQNTDGDLPSVPNLMHWYTSVLVVVDVDVTDPAQPQIVAQNALDGWLVSSRLTSGRLVLVLTQDFSPLLYAVQSTSEDVSLEQVLPKAMIGSGEQMLVPPENWLCPATPYGYALTAVVTLPAEDIQTVAGSLAVLAGLQTVYASPEAVYLAGMTISYDESAGYAEATLIHKLTFNDQDVAEYAASGVVPGGLLNQFSLGEFEGHLRVATSIGSNFGWLGFASGGAEVAVAIGGGAAGDGGDAVTNSAGQDEPVSDVPNDILPTVVEPLAPPARSNAVYVLAQDGADLKTVGKIEGIAPGERLYAARFLGDHGFLVTFKQIDPLFVLDLTDPANPRLVGELKVPGYSDYLHPIGDHLLLGVGRSTYQTEWGGVVPSGVQLSLFNVSDWANPVLIGESLVLGGLGSSSEVSYDHRAFAILPEQGLIAIPAQLMKEQGDTTERWAYEYRPEFDGVVCVRVTETDGLAELGRVASVIYEDFGWTEWRRPIFIDNALYTVTSAGVRAAVVEQFDTASTLVLVPSVEETDQGQAKE